MNNQLENDFPCTCGHYKIDHPHVGRFAHRDGTLQGDYRVCNGCFVENSPEGILQLNAIDCFIYQPDNLRYLEIKAVEREGLA